MEPAIMTRNEVLEAIQTLQKNLQQAIPEDESGQSLREQLEITLDALKTGGEYTFPAEELLTHLITYYPNFTPAIPRPLLWAIGGSCLHFLGDDEIEQFCQQEDDTRLH